MKEKIAELLSEYGNAIGSEATAYEFGDRYTMRNNAKEAEEARAKIMACVDQQTSELATLKARLEAAESKYSDLLYQVENVIPGESRHESAKRIIRQHENQSHGPDAAISKEQQG